MLSKKIIFTGPESTAKTTLSHSMASRFDATLVEEHARVFLDELGTEYTREHVLLIAQKQAENERQATGKKLLVICDTDLLSTKIWLEYYKWDVPGWMIDFIKSNKGDLYLLMSPDIPWVADPQRKNGHDRQALFSEFEKQLKAFSMNYKIIKGEGKTREENCANEIQQLLAGN